MENFHLEFLHRLYWERILEERNESVKLCPVCTEQRFSFDCERRCKEDFVWRFVRLTTNLPLIFWEDKYELPFFLSREDREVIEMFSIEEGDSKSLIFLGPGETGKSTVASKIFLRFLDQKVKAIGLEVLRYQAKMYWMDFGDCVNQIRIGNTVPEVRSFLDYVFSFYDFIVFDDIGRGYVDSEFTRTYFERVFKYRFENKKKMIITGNILLRDFDRLFGEKVRSLINQYASVVCFTEKVI